MNKSRKFLGHCEICKKSLCPEHSYCFVDGNNIAITNNSPYLCMDCYNKKYDGHIINDTEQFRQRLIANFRNLQQQNCVDSIKIDNLIEYIKNF